VNVAAATKFTAVAPSLWDMLQLVQARTPSEARPWSLAFRGMHATALCGRQSCLQAAFQATVEQTTHPVSRYSSGFVFRRHRSAKPEKFVAYRKRRPERPPAGKIACRTKGQSPVLGEARAGRALKSAARLSYPRSCLTQVNSIGASARFHYAGSAFDDAPSVEVVFP
jgi:hypothetical protein